MKNPRNDDVSTQKCRSRTRCRSEILTSPMAIERQRYTLPASTNSFNAIVKRRANLRNCGEYWPLYIACLHGTQFLDPDRYLDCDLDHFGSCKRGICHALGSYFSLPGRCSSEMITFSGNMMLKACTQDR